MARIGIDRDRLQTPQTIVQTAAKKVTNEAARAKDTANQTYQQEGAAKRKQSPNALMRGGEDYWQVQRQTDAGAGGAAKDPYAAQADALYQQLLNRGPFKYDLQGDMLYRQYADQYSQLGRQAMMDTMGTAAGLTGGYGNSWAGTVGNQAYQGYLGQLNAMIPDFYDRAYQRWQDEGNNLLDQYQLALARAGASGGAAAAPQADETDGATGDGGAYLSFLLNWLPAMQTAQAEQTADGTQVTVPVFDPEYYDAYLKKYGG